MSALLRNLVTVILAWMRYGSVTPLATVVCKFWVSPFDVGISKLKSDRVAQLAEAAQFDYLMQTGLIGTLVKQGYAFVNAAQMVQFKQAIHLFSMVTMHTRVVFADDKWVYFEHTLYAGGAMCAQVWVKMKFKKGRMTVQPNTLLGNHQCVKPAYLTAWDDALASVNT
jgi:acyl-CoA thioesterase FadM